MRHIPVALCLFATMDCFGQGLLLPPDATVKPPLESIPVTALAFSGKWQGQWDGRMPHVLLVEEVKSGSEAVVVYAWQEPAADNAWGAGWYRTQASIEGNILRVPLRNGTRAWYELLPDGTLKGSYQRPNVSNKSEATMRKTVP